MERVRRRADDRPARGDRPRLGQVAERLNGSPQNFLKEQYSALEESRADLVALYFVADPQARRARHRDGGGPGRDRARRIRGLRAQRAGPAAPDPRRHPDRRGPHAQPPDDRPLADGELDARSSPAARRQDLLRDGGSRRRSAKGSAACCAKSSGSRRKGITRPRKALFETYGVHFEPELRDEVVARVDRLQMPSYTGFVQPRLEPWSPLTARSPTSGSRIRWTSRRRCWNIRGGGPPDPADPGCPAHGAPRFAGVFPLRPAERQQSRASHQRTWTAGDHRHAAGDRDPEDRGGARPHAAGPCAADRKRALGTGTHPGSRSSRPRPPRAPRCRHNPPPLPANGEPWCAP